MKKMLYAVMVLSMLAAGSSQAAGAAEKAAKASAGSSMKGGAATVEKLEALERKAWDAFKAQDYAAFKEVMNDESVSADMNGFTSTADLEPMMKDYVIESYTRGDLKLTSIDKDAAILSYTATVTAKYKGEAAPSGPYYVVTVYANRGGKWRALYHQETLGASGMPSSATTGK